jgi:excisionase family DNA binding protein
MTNEELITLSEAARRLGVNVQTVRAWVAAGKLPAYRQGQRFTRVTWAAVLEALERPAQGAKSAAACASATLSASTAQEENSDAR